MSGLRAYAALEGAFRQAGVLGEIESILHWDAATYMPSKASEGRGEQLAAVKVLAHEALTDPRLGEWLDEAEQDSGLDDWRRANLREMRRQVVHATALPGDLVSALSRAASACETAWRAARPDNDFAAVSPALARVLDLTREAAQAKAAALGCSPYDALMDQWEPDAQAEVIDRLFAEIESFLKPFIPRVMAVQAACPAPSLPPGPFPAEAQRDFGVKLMAAIGFDFARGRLDSSLHPFCGGGGDDVRITSRYDENDFTQAVMAVLHETGHAMYELGLPPEWRRQPVGTARGMSLHESQSLSVEMQACRSRQFIDFLAPLARQAFGGDGEDWSADNLYRLTTRVQPSAIRVDADEVTYPAHVILRYRLERAMLAGDLALADLPGAWRDGMSGLVGYTPADNREGCLQDIHWYEGIWGYFPTYALGAMTAAQLFRAARNSCPELMDALTRGDFTPLIDWMRDHVHVWASRYSTTDLLIQATGKPLDAEAYKAHLTDRYLNGDGESA